MDGKGLKGLVFPQILVPKSMGSSQNSKFPKNSRFSPKKSQFSPPKIQIFTQKWGFFPQNGRKRAQKFGFGFPNPLEDPKIPKIPSFPQKIPSFPKKIPTFPPKFKFLPKNGDFSPKNGWKRAQNFGFPPNPGSQIHGKIPKFPKFPISPQKFQVFPQKNSNFPPKFPFFFPLKGAGKGIGDFSGEEPKFGGFWDKFLEFLGQIPEILGQIPGILGRIPGILAPPGPKNPNKIPPKMEFVANFDGDFFGIWGFLAFPGFSPKFPEFLGQIPGILGRIPGILAPPGPKNPIKFPQKWNLWPILTGIFLGFGVFWDSKDFPPNFQDFESNSQNF
ncbi:uncharacterized protein LOC131589877 isoform X1 [Poecile atricapillus]|uniref:uncharacterized protein LOC131589877 isoform X1 n=1 Tax=Poecile atricapillus TaxID=48891 RepID=UPI002739ABB6|nr:uncharacterized protein LOC131589877 isoform X1 [Poecile atricapillus]